MYFEAVPKRTYSIFSSNKNSFSNLSNALSKYLGLLKNFFNIFFS